MKKYILLIPPIIITNVFIIAPILFYTINVGYAATASLVVASVSGSAGGSVNVPVTFTAGDTGIVAMQFDLSIPSTLTYSSVSTGVAASSAGKTVQARFMNGSVRVFVWGMNKNIIGSGEIAVFNFNISSGVSGGIPITITNIVSSSVVAASVTTLGSSGSVNVGSSAPPPTPTPTPTPVPTTTPTPTPLPGSVSRTFYLSFEGRSVTVVSGNIYLLNPSTKTVIDSKTFTTNSQGSAVLLFVPQTASVKVVAKGYLAKIVPSVNLSVSSTVTVPTLTAGDVNGDNVINSGDLSSITANWFSKTDLTADYFKDGVINALDWSYINKNWGKSGDN